MVRHTIRQLHCSALLGTVIIATVDAAAAAAVDVVVVVVVAVA